MRDNSWRRRFRIHLESEKTWGVYENGVRRDDLSGGIGEAATILHLRRLYPFCMIGIDRGLDNRKTSAGQ